MAGLCFRWNRQGGEKNGAGGREGEEQKGDGMKEKEKEKERSVVERWERDASFKRQSVVKCGKQDLPYTRPRSQITQPKSRSKAV